MPSTSSSTTVHPYLRTQKTEKTQSSIENFIVSVKPVPISKSKQFDEQLLRMIVKEYHPFSVVEDIEFKRFVNMLCPGYSLPNRKTVADSLLPQTFNKVRERVKQQIHKAFAVCLTTDSWTSITNENFTSITAHWLDDSDNKGLKLNSNLLDCVAYNERHTAENICELLQERIKDWGIENKIAAIASDNARNIVAAIRLGNWRQLSCFAHTVNLIVQKGIKEIESTLTKIRKVVEYFKRSSHGLSKFNQSQEQMGLPILKLKIDVCTRWNSTMDMLDRFYKRKDAIISTLALLEHEITFNAKEWDMMQHAVTILEIFNEVTREISAEKNVTISKIFLFVNAMESHVEHCKLTMQSEELQPMINVLLNEITSRFRNFESNELISQATILDPRFKKYGFARIEKANQAIENLKYKIRVLVERNLSTETTQEDPATDNSTSTATASSKSCLWKTFEEKVKNVKTPSNPTAATINELEKYLSEPLIDRHEDPLIWWFQRKSIYPRLYGFVKKRLCLMATSVPCERIFSKTGQIVTEKRSRLKSKKISEIIFLHENL